MAWPNFIAPPLSSPSTRNSCSAVRAWTSAATTSAGPPADPLAQAERGPAGEAQRQCRELGRAGHRPAREVGHPPIVTECGGIAAAQRYAKNSLQRYVCTHAEAPRDPDRPAGPAGGGQPDPALAPGPAAAGGPADREPGGGGCIGESSGTCSFHLRQLARYGLVEPAPGGRGREKPWRATSLFTSWSWDAPTDEGVQAGTALSRVITQRYVELMFDWLEQVPSEPASWRRASEFGDTMLYLTASELAQLHRDLDGPRRAVPGPPDRRVLASARGAAGVVPAAGLPDAGPPAGRGLTPR